MANSPEQEIVNKINEYKDIINEEFLKQGRVLGNLSEYIDGINRVKKEFFKRCVRYIVVPGVLVLGGLNYLTWMERSSLQDKITADVITYQKNEKELKNLEGRRASLLDKDKSLEDAIETARENIKAMKNENSDVKLYLAAESEANSTIHKLLYGMFGTLGAMFLGMNYLIRLAGKEERKISQSFTNALEAEQNDLEEKQRQDGTK